MNKIQRQIKQTIKNPTTSKWLKETLEAVLAQDNFAQLWIDTQSLNRLVTNLIATELKKSRL